MTPAKAYVHYPIKQGLRGRGEGKRQMYTFTSITSKTHNEMTLIAN